jgi:hypothetical protein
MTLHTQSARTIISMRDDRERLNDIFARMGMPWWIEGCVMSDGGSAYYILDATVDGIKRLMPLICANLSFVTEYDITDLGDCICLALGYWPRSSSSTMEVVND